MAVTRKKKKTTAPKGKSRIKKPAKGGENTMQRQHNTRSPKRTNKSTKPNSVSVSAKRKANAKKKKKAIKQYVKNNPVNSGPSTLSSRGTSSSRHGKR